MCTSTTRPRVTESLSTRCNFCRLQPADLDLSCKILTLHTLPYLRLQAHELKIKGTPLSGYGKGIELKPGSAIPVSTIPGSALASPPPTQLMTEPSRTAAGKEAASGIHTIPVAAVPTTAPGNKLVRFTLEAVTAEVQPRTK
jgi:hypothetical protein